MHLGGGPVRTGWRGPRSPVRVPGGLAAMLAATALSGTLLAAAIDDAHAFEIFGINFFGSDDADETVSPDAQPYTIDFVVETADEDVADRIRAASRLWGERDDPPPPSPAALLARAEAEYARIVGAAFAEGYYGPVVTIRVAGRDPLDLPPDINLPDPVPVTILVDPGPQFVFGDVEIDGRAPPPIDPADVVEESPEDLGLIMGAIAKSTAVLATERVLVSEWREQGYPKAEIARRDAVANHPTETLDVTIVAESGPPAVYGPVAVTGTETMDPGFVAWMSGIQPGEPFDPDDLEAGQRNLRRLQIFQSSQIVEGDVVGPDGELPITVAVAERPLHVFGVGGSYSTIDGLGVEGYWQHRNLFGQAERLRIEGRVGGISGVDPEDFDYSAGITFFKPGVITPLTDLSASLLAERNLLETYTENTVRARVGLAHEFFEGVTGNVAINVEASEIRDAFDTRQFLLASLPAQLIWDARDDELDPTEGFFGRIGVEPFYEFQFENAGLIASVEGSTYLSFDEENRFVLAARAALGSIVGAPRDQIPENRLFFAGGGGSVRGYAYRNIGPVVNGEVVGGRSFFEASLELRARVTDTIGIVPFVDAGSAFASSLPDFSEDIKFGAGIGLRYYTGLGPIRLDAAVPLNPGPDDPSFAVYIGLGQAF